MLTSLHFFFKFLIEGITIRQYALLYSLEKPKATNETIKSSDCGPGT